MGPRGNRRHRGPTQGQTRLREGGHHDAVRSSDNHTVYKWGHKWVTLSVVIKFPFASRPWALPVLEALYRPEELKGAEGRRHKTPAQLARGLMAALMHWFPERKFVFLGDGGYASHQLARFCRRYRRRCALVSRFHANAAFYEPPPKYGGHGRPRVKGKKLRVGGEVVAGGDLIETVVDWYGATERNVKVISGSGQWYKAGQGLVPVQWVFVRDATGTHRDEYFYCTLPGVFTAEQIVSFYTRRWNIEVTFQEIRAHLGFETTRHWAEKSVLRVAPLLMGLFSVVCLIYHEHLKRHSVKLNDRPGYEKTEPTFSDALTTVRELFWTETFFQQPYFRRVLKNIPPKMWATILAHLAQAV
ncbi:MAG TPA: hypothetical protein EYP14_01910 [Planctomycetaceae bacterium]|nr:hypothetical protein [Planctomycetaceae bacterium]